MYYQLNKVWIVSVFLCLSACSGSHLSQQDVARDFWTAMAADDLDTAKTYAKKGTMDGITPNKESKIDKVDLKPTTIKEGIAIVPTAVTSTENGEQKTLSFNTVLAQENGEWKVDFEKTTTSMMGISMQEMMEGMGKAMGEVMKGVGEAVGKGLGGQKP